MSNYLIPFNEADRLWLKNQLSKQLEESRNDRSFSGVVKEEDLLDRITRLGLEEIIVEANKDLLVPNEKR